MFGNPDQTRMSLSEHLEELRWRLIKALASVVIMALVCFYFGDHIFQFLCQPLAMAMRRAGMNAGLVNLTPHEAFLTYFKTSFICGVMLSAPYWFYQGWGFVAAGLHRHERRWVHVFAPASLLLFAVGVLFLFYIVLPATLYFFLYFQQRYIPKPVIKDTLISKLLFKSEQPTDSQPQVGTPARTMVAILPEDPPEPADGQIWINRSEGTIKMRVGSKIRQLASYDDNSFVHGSALSIASYISFVTLLALGFGLCFQVPIVVIFLAITGLVSPEQFRRSRKYVILAVLIIAALITPTPDFQTQLLLAIPMLCLFELGLLASRLYLAIAARRRDNGQETPPSPTQH